METAPGGASKFLWDDNRRKQAPGDNMKFLSHGNFSVDAREHQTTGAPCKNAVDYVLGLLLKLPIRKYDKIH